MCLLFWDEVVDVAFVDYTVLGPNIKLMARLPRDENVFGEIAERLRGTEKTPAQVTLCLPRADVMQRTLRYPAMVRDDIGNMIQFEATRHVPLPEEDRALSYSMAAPEEAKHVVLDLLAARKSVIHNLIASFEAVQVPVDRAVSLSSLVSPILGSAPTLLVVSDAKGFELCLYGGGMLQDSLVVKRQTAGFSAERVVTAARQMAAKHKEWLGDEGIGRVLLAGPGEVPPSLEGDLGVAFGLHPLGLEIPYDLQTVVAETAAQPLAEALLAVVVEMPSTLNLIEHTERKVPISKRTMIIAALCALLAIELLAAVALKTTAPMRQRKAVAREVAALKRKAAPIQAMKDENRALRKQLVQLEELCKNRMSTMEILRVLSDALPEDTYLRSIYYQRADSLRIRGMSKEPTKLPELVQALPFTKAIEASEVEKKEGEYHEFTMTVALRSSSDEKNDS
jgi:Tfp pilus assembly protein PilN